MKLGRQDLAVVVWFASVDELGMADTSDCESKLDLVTLRLLVSSESEACLPR